MLTYFAPAERLSKEELAGELAILSNNPVVNALMNAVSGLIAVLNQHRQVLALNDQFLQLLGIDNPGEALGLRLGESIGCVHARDLPGGCGTTEYCRTCGAAIAMVTSLDAGQSVEKNCAVTIKRMGQEQDLFLRVRSSPVVLDETRFLLIFLQDITTYQSWAMLERVFFHDISNIIMALIGRIELMSCHQGQPTNETLREVRNICFRLAQEIKIQQSLLQAERPDHTTILGDTSVSVILAEIRSIFASHPAASKKTLLVRDIDRDIRFTTDSSLLIRVLSNMITNALEASRDGDEVRVCVDAFDGMVTFSVWNRGAIPQEVMMRIFQRNFSTKEGQGRGLGTYSMKLFGERYLGGRIEYSSSETEGTTFRFSLGV